MFNRKVKSILDINDDILTEKASKIPYFTMKDRFIPVKIVRIVDGDTVDLVCVVPVPKATVNLSFDKTIPMITKLRCRLRGIDAAEIKDPRGPVAATLLHSICMENKTQLYGQFGDNGMFGRKLVELFINSKSINNILLDHRDPFYGVCYQKYDGKRKRKPFPLIIPPLELDT